MNRSESGGHVPVQRLGSQAYAQSSALRRPTVACDRQRSQPPVTVLWEISFPRRGHVQVIRASAIAMRTRRIHAPGGPEMLMFSAVLSHSLAPECLRPKCAHLAGG